jgi:uncharacterized phage protein (TIGR01671 family)
MYNIKFRGKTLKTNQWAYGVPVYCKTGECFMFCEAILLEFTQKDVFREGNDNHSRECVVKEYEVDPATVGQYGEEKDTLGKEIYEGDLIDVECDYCDAGHHIYEVKRDGCTLTIDACGESEYDYSVLNWALEVKRNSGNKYVVIGNIHDNPELVKP